MKMKIALAADHNGFELKKDIYIQLEKAGYEVLDLGPHLHDPLDDYPDYADKLAASLTKGECQRGIMICGSGVGASVAANKVSGIRAAVCHDIYSAHQGVEHDDMNVLCLGARIIGSEVASELVKAFVNASFTDEKRHERRLKKVLKMERHSK
jgi:ribose 5-phosphate isomerase B